MADDPLETAPVTTPPAVVKERKTKCVFCDCVMTADGLDIWHLGDRAKEYQALEKTITKKDEEIARISDELRTVKAERDELKAQILSPGQGKQKVVGRIVS